jgi:WXG100 family type VII secretion target
MSSNIIQANYDTLDTVAARFGQQAEATIALQGNVLRSYQALADGGWQGRGFAAFSAEMESDIFPTLQRLTHALEEARAVTLEASAVMRQAEEEAASVFQGGDYAGMAGDRAGVARSSVAAGVAGAAAGVAHTAVVAGMAGAGNTRSQSGDGSTQTDDSDSGDTRTDRRVDRRIESDERWRRPPGGSRGGDHFDYDWAGGAILERYLTGGDDWYIKNDPRWTEYMQSNASLTANLRDRAVNTAQELFRSEKTQMHVDESFLMTMENGEGIVGYQYLHGTNANVGGFQRQGTASIEPNENGGYTVTMNMDYTWNDVIDPNPQYVTDNWKSQIAEIITLGQADPYEIHISWSETTVVHLDANGNPLYIGNSS